MKSPRASVLRRLATLTLAATMLVALSGGCDDGKSDGTVKETPHGAETTKNMENFMKSNPKSVPPASAPSAAPATTVK